MKTAKALMLATMLAISSISHAADNSGSDSNRSKSGAVTDDGNAGTMGERTLTPAERERCKEAPPNDATCEGVAREQGQ
jgi:Spy/CpxP family protein refolding chaperone